MTETKNNAILIKRIVKKIGKTNLLEFFSVSTDNLSKVDKILPGLSDHDIVRVLVNTIPSQTKQVPRNIPLYKKADWDQFKQTMKDFQSELLTDLATTDVQELWDMFASRLEQGIDKFIPTRKAGTRDGFPWINQEICRLMRKRDKLYKKMKRSGRPNDTKKFLEYKGLLERPENT